MSFRSSRRRIARRRSLSSRGRNASRTTLVADRQRPVFTLSMTEAEVTARARADRDARPVPRKRLGELRRVSLSPNEVRSIRRRSGLSQSAFAARYGLNLRTLQDWEQGRAQPDGPARAYLLVILREPSAVERALAAG